MALPFVDFRPAQVMGKKEVYVCYYVSDPTNGKLKRIRVRCNRIKDHRELKKYAALLCAQINAKLYNGWNPLMMREDAQKNDLKITVAASDYVKKKAKELRSDSLRSYRSKLNFFTNWCERQGISTWLCKNFTCKHAASLLEEYGNGGRSAYSFNSILQYLKGMFRHFVSNGTAAYNPFEAFEGKRREVKRRTTTGAP